MKKSRFLVFSTTMLAAYSSSFFVDFQSNLTIKIHDSHKIIMIEDEGDSRMAMAQDKFAPRFDGLRFIETLVTAHR
ncbi:hypothetical protein ACHQM5_017330 [Ranunculus cassubicifolius]